MFSRSCVWRFLLPLPSFPLATAVPSPLAAAAALLTLTLPHTFPCCRRHSEVFKARHKATGKLCALKKVILKKEQEGVSVKHTRDGGVRWWLGLSYPVSCWLQSWVWSALPRGVRWWLVIAYLVSCWLQSWVWSALPHAHMVVVSAVASYTTSTATPSPERWKGFPW